MSEIYQLNTNEDLTFHPISEEVGGRLIYGKMRHRKYGDITKVRITKLELTKKFSTWKAKISPVHGAQI